MSLPSTTAVSGGRGAGGGPDTTAPVAGLNRPSWQGQTIIVNAASQATMQPRWVQIAEYALTPPEVFTTTAGLAPTATTAPEPTGSDSRVPASTRPPTPAVAVRLGMRKPMIGGTIIASDETIEKPSSQRMNRRRSRPPVPPAPLAAPKPSRTPATVRSPPSSRTGGSPSDMSEG